MTDTTQGFLSIGEVAEKTGLTVHGLRFYEKEGLLLNPVLRDSGDRRRYTSDDVDWLLHVCLKLKASGMPIDDIRRYTELARNGTDETGNAAERLALMKRHRTRLKAQIAELNSCLDLVDYKVRIYGELAGSG